MTAGYGLHDGDFELYLHNPHEPVDVNIMPITRNIKQDYVLKALNLQRKTLEVKWKSRHGRGKGERVSRMVPRKRQTSFTSLLLRKKRFLLSHQRP